MKIFGVLCKSLVRFYQLFIAPVLVSLGVQCRFTPTCSHYALAAIDKYGAFQGLYLSIHRVFRCHPLCVGGHDPIP